MHEIPSPWGEGVERDSYIYFFLAFLAKRNAAF